MVWLKLLIRVAEMKVNQARDPNTVSAKATTNKDVAARVSVGDPAADSTKTSGIKIRGTGAAQRGVTARGPMA